MQYTIKATGATPALIIYLIDVSASMELPLGKTTRIAASQAAMRIAIMKMIFQATKGAIVSPRYRLSILAYSDKIHPLFQGIEPIDSIERMITKRGGMPSLSPLNATNAAAAFAEAERILRTELPKIQHCPAPLVCHVTDAQVGDWKEDPLPIAQRIMDLSIPDGNVLIENIYITDKLSHAPVGDFTEWYKNLTETLLRTKEGAKLLAMSSPLPENYRERIKELTGYIFPSEARLLIPGTSPALVEAGFVASTMTGTSK